MLGVVNLTWTRELGSKNLYCNTVSVTTNAVQLSTDGQEVNEVMIQNDPDSTAAIMIGNSTNRSWQIPIGGSVTIPALNLNQVYVVAPNGTTATANYLARGEV